MNSFRFFTVLALSIGSLAACSDDKTKPASGDEPDAGSGDTPDSGPSETVDASPGDTSDSGADASTKAALDLTDVKTNPTSYAFGDFRPNIQKLILAGTADSKHIAVLWYTTDDGGVALHYHAKTESVYVIDGSQTDGKGVYPTGTAYFNPPGSGHQVTDSHGFFLLSYAAPPDFTSTDRIEEYTPIKIDTTDPELTTTYAFEEKSTGVKVFAPALDAEGGLSAQLVETTSPDAYAFSGNYVLVLKGSCVIDGATYGKDMLVVGKTVAIEPYAVAAPDGATCLVMGVSF